MTSLSPAHTIGNQIMEAILLHKTKDKNEAHQIAVDMLSKVGIPNPELRINAYPHLLSGGLRQRAIIAMALSCDPSPLIADEPTIHDLGVIAEIADHVAMMYLGKVVEHTTPSQLFHDPKHPYTQNLLKSIPKVGLRARERLQAIEGFPHWWK